MISNIEALKSCMSSYEEVDRKHKQRLNKLCGEEIKAFEEAKLKLEEKLKCTSITTDEELLSISQIAANKQYEMRKQLNKVNAEYEQLLEEIYFDKTLDSDLKKQRSEEVLLNASSQVQELYTRFPAAARAQMLKIIY